MGAKGESVADAGDGGDELSARTEVTHSAQELHRVPVKNKNREHGNLSDERALKWHDKRSQKASEIDRKMREVK